MVEGLEALSNMEYPGGFIILGKDGQLNGVIIYGITGRSPPSQARRLVFDDAGERIFVEPTDPKLLEEGDPDLLLYDAIKFTPLGNVVGNGKQTDTIYEFLSLSSLAEVVTPQSITTALTEGTAEWTYEPDKPNNTPRISGVADDSRYGTLGIIRKGPGSLPERQFFSFPLFEGSGKLISTYTGENVNPLPPFIGEPLNVQLFGKTAEENATAVYNALRPDNPNNDFRVAVAAVHYEIKDSISRSGRKDVYIINRHDS